MNKYPERECPKCDCEMITEIAVSDGWDYGTDSHTTSETNVFVCTNKDCKYEYEDDEEPFNVDGDE